MTTQSAGPMAVGSLLPASDADDLSAEQITQLLKDAEQRLRPSTAAVATAGKSILASLPKIPTLGPNNAPQPYVTSNGEMARVDSSRLLNNDQRKKSEGLRKVEDPAQVKAKLQEKKKADAGGAWFNMPKTNVTPELKQDLQLLQMRSVLDPKRHYKKDSSRNKVPEFSQVGTIIEGPTEFYSSRLSNKERKQTLAGEILAGEQESGRFKRKYNDIQDSKTSGKKAYYKALKAKRSKRG
ncbi:Fcf2-domain-containing protein [Xylona heveae TC161]|uniref:Fcf2-domain-containing protein n=1 Tax=Xylona heveae (strain CBS 132557 / TC161) TaxID=1328760 RepID=A0A165FNY0_XYLHT|nr:Fcf2-domain-containing protein [Xylona heveae TC161]KZF21206.1 Fcf2-domain-containing protein [Xylona heveae TC161]